MNAVANSHSYRLWLVALCLLAVNAQGRWLLAQSSSVSAPITAVPRGAPLETTGRCGDGSFTVAAVSAGACSRHGGLRLWWGLQGARPLRADLAPRTVAELATEQQVSATSRQQALAGTTESQGSVWINTRSRVYHCPGSRYFGQTSKGRYSTEAEAVLEGARPAYGRKCRTQP